MSIMGFFYSLLCPTVPAECHTINITARLYPDVVTGPEIMESQGHVREAGPKCQPLCHLPTSACPSLAGLLAPTPIVKARHSPQTPPYPTQKTPLPPIPFPDPTDAAQRSERDPNRRNGDAHRPLLRPSRRRGLRAAAQGLRRSHSDPRPHSSLAPARALAARADD